MKLWDKDERTAFNQRFVLSKGRNVVLDKKLVQIRKKRKKLYVSQVYTCYTSGDMIQVWLQTRGCRFSASGTCSICDYWDGIYIKGMAGILKNALESFYHGERTLLLNSCGSFLDNREIPPKDFEEILMVVSKYPFENIILESHMLTLNESKIRKIETYLYNKQVYIELGQESINEDVLYYCLNKTTNLHSEKFPWKKFQKPGMGFILNVVLGSPILGVSERMEDAVETIRTLISEGADGIVLFPVNIKEFTLIYWLYQRGLYERVYGREICKVLYELEPEMLAKVNVSWYGDREQNNQAYDSEILGPYYCSECEEATLEALVRYNRSDSWQERKAIVSDMMGRNCKCSVELDQLLRDKDVKFKYRVTDIYEKIIGSVDCDEEKL